MVGSGYFTFDPRVDWSGRVKIWSFYIGLCLYGFILSFIHSLTMNAFIYLSTLPGIIVIH